MTAALVSVSVEGWTLFREGEGYLVRDLDLSVQAGMANRHDIRPHVKKCAEDKLLTILAPGEKGPPEGAYAVAVPEVVAIGSGAHREVTAYYLNREAALHVVMRLRTPRAVDLQVAIVRVFLRAIEGPPMDPVLVSKANGKPLTKKQAEVLVYLRAYVRQFGGAPTIREIAAHFGLASTNAAQDHLNALERKGAIRLRGDGKARGIIILDMGDPPKPPAPPPAAAPPPDARIDRLERLVEQLVGALASLVGPRRRLPPRGGGQGSLPFAPA